MRPRRLYDGSMTEQAESTRRRRWAIEARDRETGAEQRLEIEAADEREAMDAAWSRGLVIEDVRPLPWSRQKPQRRKRPRPAWLDEPRVWPATCLYAAAGLCALAALPWAWLGLGMIAAREAPGDMTVAGALLTVILLTVAAWLGAWALAFAGLALWAGAKR